MDMAAISIEVTFGDHQWGESFEGLFFFDPLNMGLTWGQRHMDIETEKECLGNCDDMHQIRDKGGAVL
ncbi:hypothetical protein [Paenibacillus sp. UMB7766-LJ446]|uniref:hypothetical protein n=1 Tax=Paenibacillus sp. UMB7766-LJ446 TaxID=3046313 RepID=UPI002550C7FE|nr:hypothetical protein [Paenibacillus sp. UMB7766-LJ446]